MTDKKTFPTLKALIDHYTTFKFVADGQKGEFDSVNSDHFQH